MTAVETYAALVDATNVQRTRLRGEEQPATRGNREIAQRLTSAPLGSMAIVTHAPELTPYRLKLPPQQIVRF